MNLEEALHLAQRHHQAGDLPQAESIYRQILAVHPNHAAALHGLGFLAHQAGKNDIAVTLIERAITIDPTNATYHSNLANLLRTLGRATEAVDAARRAIAIDPNFAAAHSNLGNALEDLGRLDEAIDAYTTAVRIDPGLPTAVSNLANALATRGDLDEAIARCRQSIDLQPTNAQAHDLLGCVLHLTGQLDEAAQSHRRAIALDPNYANAYTNLANALADQGLIEEAVAAIRQALQLRPDFVQAHSNRLYYLHFHPTITPQAILEEHRLFDRLHAQPLAREIQPHANDPYPNRPLRIGYVSADFRDHPLARFMLPILSHHDKQSFEIFCYSDALHEDSVSAALRTHASTWRRTSRLSHAQLADLIRADCIDILVDLSLHTGGNRILTFARKPAPIQLTYLGYPGTTGLSAMDYRLTDNFLDPPGNDSFYTEHSLRLQTYWCYDPPSLAPEIAPLPALSNNFIAFACLNHFSRISPGAFTAWCRILAQVPRSHLLLFAHQGPHRDRLLSTAASLGIDPGRIEFLPHRPLSEYFATYNRIDIALDPFPYTGGTTTCDALYMGVPVVTLAGKIAVHRGGVSILNQISMPELVSHTIDDYVSIATDLAADLPRLSSLRQSLRGRMLASPLCDAPAFVRNLENTFRQMLP